MSNLARFAAYVAAKKEGEIFTSDDACDAVNIRYASISHYLGAIDVDALGE